MTEKFGLIGYPLGHSFSKRYFTEKFLSEGIDAIYSQYPLEHISEMADLIAREPSLKGLNVTIPYKEVVKCMLNGLSEEAEAIGAVNVVKIDRQDEDWILTGFNSDYIGFSESLKPLLTPRMNRALVLGTGGASKAVCYALENLGITPIKVSRTPGKGELSYADITEKVMDSHLLIVNTTPLGMFPNTTSFPPIPYRFLTPGHLCYDLVYNPEITEFLRKSAQQGAMTKNGLEMLYLQADISWRIWNNLL